jgi:hypothetical protein
MMPEWALAIAVVIGTIIGASIGEFRHWRESKERYHVITFEKRLETHQEAFKYCFEINEFLGLMRGGDLQALEDFKKVIVDAKGWWFSHCLYLDDSSRNILPDVFEVALINAEELSKELDKAKKPDIETLAAIKSNAKAKTKIAEAIVCIIKGIGVKYLPEIKKQLKS